MIGEMLCAPRQLYAQGHIGPSCRTTRPTVRIFPCVCSCVVEAFVPLSKRRGNRVCFALLCFGLVWSTWFGLNGLGCFALLCFIQLCSVLLGIALWEERHRDCMTQCSHRHTLRALMTCPDLSTTPVARPLSICTWSTCAFNCTFPPYFLTPLHSSKTVSLVCSLLLQLDKEACSGSLACGNNIWQ